MELKGNLLRGVYYCNLEKPSYLQQRAISPIIKENDIIVQGDSGAGKTTSFAISILQIITENNSDIQALVLCPLREAAQSIASLITQLANYLKVKIHAFVGGTSLKADIKHLSEGVNVVVGTPGRVLDMINKKILKLDKLKICVLDETEEMLNRGFIECLTQIVNLLPKSSQRCMFTTTLSNEVNLLSKQFFLKTPVKLLLKEQALTLEGIRQYYVPVQEKWKLEILLNLFKMMEISQSIIFCNSRERVEFVTEELVKKGFSVASIDSNQTQEQKDRIFSNFISGNSRIIVTHDLARRNDIWNTNFVINYDIPSNPEEYIKRIGRSGRFHRKGTAINLVGSDDDPKLLELQKHYNTSFKELPNDLSQV